MSKVRYRSIDGEMVSRLWYPLLHDIRTIDKVPFNVNEGHRTMARQQYFYDLYLSGRGNLAAVPSSNAPHIRTGRPDHAIDFNNAAGVIAAARKRGVTLRRTVLGEEWHLEASVGELRKYRVKRALRLKTLLKKLKKAKRAWKRAKAAYNRRLGR